jgi:hypothetical protein
MPELATPTTCVHASFLAAMEEFRAEGRGGPGDGSMTGRAIHAYGGRWQQPTVSASTSAGCVTRCVKLRFWVPAS